MRGERGLLASSAAAAPNPEAEAKPKRRRFSAAYRLRILEEAERCQGPGEVGRLRREGLYSSHLAHWRKACREGSLAAVAPKRRGPKPKARNPLESVVQQLEAKVRRLEAELVASRRFRGGGVQRIDPGAATAPRDDRHGPAPFEPGSIRDDSERPR